MVTNPDCKTKKPIENDLEHMAPFEDDSGVELLVRVIASGFYVPPIKHIQHIRELKLKHNQAVKLVKCLCEQVRSLEDLEAYRSLARNPLLVAAKLGIHEIIEEIVNSFPEAIFALNADDLYIFELAVIKRHENVFNLLYQLGEDKQYFARSRDNEGNTLLHLVGNKAPIEKLNVVPGAALQMQRELQWFKEVEKFVSPSYIDEQNDDGETPSTVFTNKHMDLVVEGEKWMKNRATSCTIAATLITITAVVFAAAMTVPGGNNNTSGLPIFSAEKAFIIFVVSDAIALFMSTTSLLIFLSILTSRYAEDDFLYVLPHRLIIGLVTLFLSITTMIVAFSSTFCLMLGDKNSWLLSLVVTSASLPISCFMLLQFPLLVDLMSSTYGPGIFGKQSNRSLY
ncbi:Ankyrin repeat-containing protein ITN1 [Camellia lanceoleosa]|uniref:Ankyrin repeat-containing protein ITN1 n=1 Tax=Camellia lanceoleosa TaxID=1840588 RepID=A0ACC0I2X2_9ERIC|nr:Ankyrin repeat-containing protein ITN1 [Camellia lanceoleosa]